MIISSRGIVFNTIDFRETSIIAKIFTETQGFQSYVVNGVRSARSKQGQANFQPLTLLEIVAYHHHSRDLHRLSDSKIVFSPQTLHQIKKTTVLLFLAEILSKVLQHETDENLPLFRFVWNSIITYDGMDVRHENFHISFLMQLTKYLGFDLSLNEEIEKMSHGDDRILEYLKTVSCGNYFQWYPISGESRNNVLVNLISEYRHHIDHLSEIKSLRVLNMVFHK